MASGVNVKMGVSGVAQFKQSINQAKTSIKTLDAQLALTEKQYKATGDAETYMQQKTEQLQSKLEAQRTVVQNAEKALNDMRTRGVDMNSKAFQDMVQQLARANADLLDTQMQMQGVEAAADDSAAAVTDMASELSSIGSQVSFKTVTEGLDKIADGLSHAAIKAIDLGKELVRSMLGAGEWADQINEEAQKAGLDPETYQRMLKTANIIDTSVDSIISSKDKLGRAAYDAGDNIKEIFASLGIQYQRYGETGNLDELFWKTGEALMKLDDDAKRADWGKTLFGNWRELIPLFTAGEEEYKKTMESMSVVDKKHLDDLQKQDDAYKTLQEEINTLKMNFLGELSPTATKVMESMTGMVQKFNEYIQSEKGQQMMESLADNIEKLFSSVTNFDPDQAIQKVGEVMGTIQSGFEWISNNWSSVETGLKAIAAGWALIKAATFGLKIGELVTGLKGLPGFGGGGNPMSTGGSAAGASGAALGTAQHGGFWAKIATGAKAFVSSGALTTGGVTLAALLPAIVANALDDQRVEAKRLDRLASASMMQPGMDRDFLERATNALGLKWHGGNEAEVESILMGMKDRSDLQKAQLQSMLNGSTANGYSTWEMLQRYWNGEPMDMGQLNATLESVTDAYQKMSEQSDELQGSTDDSAKASNEMTAAAKGLLDIPGMIESAVISGMSQVKIYIDGQQAGSAVAPYVDGAMGGVLAMFRS